MKQDHVIYSNKRPKIYGDVKWVERVRVHSCESAFYLSDREAASPGPEGFYTFSSVTTSCEHEAPKDILDFLKRGAKLFFGLRAKFKS